MVGNSFALLSFPLAFRGAKARLENPDGTRLSCRKGPSWPPKTTVTFEHRLYRHSLQAPPFETLFRSQKSFEMWWQKRPTKGLKW